MFYSPTICSHLVVALFAVGAWAGDGLGCYASVDTSVSKGYNAYQTQSSCAASCGSAYPYVAVRDGGYCYCLLLLPTDETDSSNCDVKCNGYGQDNCGGASAYTVFTGDGTVSSAAASALDSLSSTLSSSSSKSSSAASAKSSQTVSASEDLITSAAGSALDAAASSTTASSLSLSTAASSLSSYTTVTKTASSSASSTASSSSAASGGNKKSSNTGAIAGGVVGGVVAVALIAVGVFFLMRRRGSDDDHEEELYEKGAGVSRGGTAKGARANPAFDMPMANPFSDQFADKRASNMTTAPLSDPRLNPAMMGRRRILEGLLADETDYSRKILGVANP